MPNFSVVIVGYQQGQEHYFKDGLAKKDQGFPIVQLPLRPPPHPDLDSDETSQGARFYVVVRNISKSTVRLDLAASSWYECLHFSLTTPDGKTFQVSRPPTAWAANPIVSWVFQPDGVRIFIVDFTAGRWQGLPPYGSVRSGLHYMVDAHFQYYDWEREKSLDFRSGLLEVRNGW